MIIKAEVKPQVVEAVQVNGNHDSIQEALDFVGNDVSDIGGIHLFTWKNDCVHAGYVPIGLADNGSVNIPFGCYIVKNEGGDFTVVTEEGFSERYRVIN